MNQQPEKNWWGRNWKWFVPVGCLSILVLFAVFVGLILTLVFGMMKSSDVYKVSVAEAQAHPAVQEVMGLPMEPGLFVSGNINTSGPSGEANLAIPISGPRGEGTIYVVAENRQGSGSFRRLLWKSKQPGRE